MEPKDWLSLTAIILGPFLGIFYTFWREARKEKRAAKERLFMTLMSHRRSTPNLEWATALNLIDVVYHDHPVIVKHWHTLYDFAQNNRAGSPDWVHEYLNMLAEMAKVLGYNKLKQTDIDKFYLPIAIGSKSEKMDQLQDELLRVLKNTESLKVRSGKPGTQSAA